MRKTTKNAAQTNDSPVATTSKPKTVASLGSKGNAKDSPVPVASPAKGKSKASKSKAIAAPTTPAPVAPVAKEKNGLRKPQVRILLFLARMPQGATRKEIAEGSPVDNACCTEYVGSTDDVIRAKNDAGPFGRSLISRGLVSRDREDVAGEKTRIVHFLSAAGVAYLRGNGHEDAVKGKSAVAPKAKASKAKKPTK